jgi:hypothetical protein
MTADPSTLWIIAEAETDQPLDVKRGGRSSDDIGPSFSPTPSATNPSSPPANESPSMPQPSKPK